MSGLAGRKKSRIRLNWRKPNQAMLSAPPITRAAKRREEQDSQKMAEGGDDGGPVNLQDLPALLPQPEAPLGPAVLQHVAAPPLVQQKSAQKPGKKKRRAPKTELRFQRLEDMMAQLLQQQRPVPATPTVPAQTPAAWLTTTSRPTFGLPRPTISAHPVYSVADTPYPRPQPSSAGSLPAGTTSPPGGLAG